MIEWLSSFSFISVIADTIIPIGSQKVVLCIDHLTRRTFEYATPISFNDNPQKVKALDPVTNESYVLTPKRVVRATPTLFEPEEFQSCIIHQKF